MTRVRFFCQLRLSKHLSDTFHLRAAFIAELDAGRYFRLALWALKLFLCRTAFATELCSGSQFRAAFRTWYRPAGDLQFRAALIAEL